METKTLIVPPFTRYTQAQTKAFLDFRKGVEALTDLLIDEAALDSLVQEFTEESALLDLDFESGVVVISGLTESQKEKLKYFLHAEIFTLYKDQKENIQGL